MRRGRGWRTLVVVGLVALVAAACGNDSGGSGASDTSGDMTIPTGPPVSGEPFNIGVIYAEGVSGIDLPDLRNGAEAAGEYVNKELGGIGGRPVEIMACNGKADPAQNAACAQQFVDDNAIGVTGLDPTWGDNGLPITDEAGIAFVGLPVSNAEFLTPTSHPFGGGSLTAFPALAKYAVDDLDVQNAVVLYADLEAGELAANALLGDPLRADGVNVELIPEAVGAADYTSAVVKANDANPDIIFILFSSVDCGRIIQAAQQVGVTAQLAGSGSCADPSALEIAGEDALNGFLLNSDTHYLAKEGEPEFEDAEIFRDRIVRYADQEPTSFSAATFSEVVTLVDIANQVADAQGVDAVNAQTVLAQIESVTDQPIFMGDVLDSTNPVELAGVQTGVYARTQRIYQFENGDFIDVGGGWIDGFA